MNRSLPYDVLLYIVSLGKVVIAPCMDGLQVRCARMEMK